jgi:alkylhydroperoxidase family enzyme
VGTSATWFPVAAPASAEGETTWDRVIDHRPAYAAAFRDVEAALWGQDVLDPGILELCRLRIAQLLGADGDLRVRTPAAAAAAGRLDESLIDVLAQWPTAPGFSEQQRSCLGYAEQVLVDAQGVTDELAAEVVEAVGEGGFLVLTYACGFFETTQRARLLLEAGER